MITPYRCYLHGKQGNFPGFQSLHAESDVQAKHIAVKILHDRPSVEWLEVWRDQDLVFHLNRHDIADPHLAKA